MRRALGVSIGLIAVAAGVVVSLPQDDTFPHESHASLFPTCVGCHAGIESGDPSSTYSVTAADCEACHNGTTVERVEWTTPESPATNLDYSHTEHAAALEEQDRDALDCAACHQALDSEERMAVRVAVVERCVDCHTPDGPEHLAQADCSVCHFPLVEAERLPAVRVAALPNPETHKAIDFVITHGASTRPEDDSCAVCHSRESCERCHLNAGDLEPVLALGRDARIAALMQNVAGEWPEPENHDRPDWAWAHGTDAESGIESCANCHTRTSCEQCHTSGAPTIAMALPIATPGGPRGVELTNILPIGHAPGFLNQHATAAAVNSPDCRTCHVEQQCIDCHDASSRPRFHAVDFVTNHATEGFGNDGECAACHSREAFCRDCHTLAGQVASSRGRGGFHDAQPDWLIGHGRAARQDLEGCVTCHDENSCLGCHSAKSGFRVSPHGPDFDPDHVADKSTQMCAICHFDL